MEENSGIVTSDSAFKGLYCTELRSLQDNAQHPIAIQTKGSEMFLKLFLIELN